MGERKVQAKYYPPDFDPSLLPRAKKKRPNDDAVRFMLPMSVRCETCGEFMGTGLKFNARKSDTGDNYLGIRIFRFTMKCKACPASFAIRTDPQNSDYACDSGVRRNYEPWRDKEKAEKEVSEERARQDQHAVQALENKTIDAKQQMDDLDALDNIKALNASRAKISVEDVIARYRSLDDGVPGEAEDDDVEREVQLTMQKKLRKLPKHPLPTLPPLPPTSQSTVSVRNLRSPSVGLLPSTLNVSVKVKKRGGGMQRGQLSARTENERCPDSSSCRVQDQAVSLTPVQPSAAVSGTPLSAYDDVSSSDSSNDGDKGD